jgi:hypothetical protein
MLTCLADQERACHIQDHLQRMSMPPRPKDIVGSRRRCLLGTSRVAAHVRHQLGPALRQTNLGPPEGSLRVVWLVHG